MIEFNLDSKIQGLIKAASRHRKAFLAFMIFKKLALAVFLLAYYEDSAKAQELMSPLDSATFEGSARFVDSKGGCHSLWVETKKADLQNPQSPDVLILVDRQMENDDCEEEREDRIVRKRLEGNQCHVELISSFENRIKYRELYSRNSSSIDSWEPLTVSEVTNPGESSQCKGYWVISKNGYLQMVKDSKNEKSLSDVVARLDALSAQISELKAKEKRSARRIAKLEAELRSARRRDGQQQLVIKTSSVSLKPLSLKP
ncbi:MAG: hypothetical protein AB1540_00520 [Bdellovibrionota bacterium]